MRKLLFVSLLAFMAIFTACGGGSGSGSGNGGGGGNNGGGGNSVSVSVAPPSATVALNGTQQFSATVTPSTAAQTVTWTVAAGSATCSGAACGQIDANGLYTAPSALPGGTPPTVKVTATSTQDTSKSSSATVTLVSSQNTRISGTYTFRFGGFDSTGKPVVSIGNFSADGNGGIGAGSMDVSATTGQLTRTINGGSYSVGSDGRGDMKLTTSTGDTFCWVFAVGSTTIDNPLFVQFNNVAAPVACTGSGLGTGTHGSGLMNLATPSSFNKGSLKQPYVFELNGFNSSGARVSYAGRFVGDGAGNVTAWSLDVNNNGTPTASSGTTGTYTVAAGGIGTVTLTGGTTPVTLNMFIKNSDELFLSVADPLATNPSAAGVAESQDTTPVYDNTTFNGVGVFYATGVASNPAQGRVILGLATTNGAGSVSGSVDQNNAGSITSNASFTGGTYSATGSGRYTITLNNISFVMYAITTNKGFILDQASTAVMSGLLEPQTTNPISASTIGGTFVQTAQQASTATAQDMVAALMLNASSGAVTGTQDETDGSENPNQTVTGTYTVSSNGRGTFNLTAPATSSEIVYVIDQSKFVVISVDTTNTSPQVLVNGH